MSKASNRSLFFYQGDKPITVNQGDHHRAIFRRADIPLGEQQAGDKPGSWLMAADNKSSVLRVQGKAEEEEHRYSVYGHDPSLPSAITLAGFNGERLEAFNHCQMLGNGYRPYSPALMRFIAPDNLSPFGKGAPNAYAYCQGDPVNFCDPSGHVKSIIRNIEKLPSIQIEIDHPRKPSEPSEPSEPSVNLLEKPGNTRNYKLEPKTHNSTFHRETLYILEAGETKVHISQSNLSEYLANDIELRQLTAPLSANGHNPPLSPSVSKYLSTEIKSRMKRNDFIVKLGESLLAKAEDPTIEGLYIRGSYRSSRGMTP